MANYWVSGVWKNTNGVIIHLQIHQVMGNVLGNGFKQSASQIHRGILDGHEFYTCQYTYNGRTWDRGALISRVPLHNGFVLRTHKDSAKTDNLDNMIDMQALGF